MKKIILVMLIAIVSLYLIGCSGPEQEVKSVTNDYYNALVNGNYKGIRNVIFI